MTHCVKSIAPLRSALSAALVGFFLSYPLIFILLVLVNFAARSESGALDPTVLITIPLFVATILFIFVLLGALIYNLLARFGIAISFEVTAKPAPATESS